MPKAFSEELRIRVVKGVEEHGFTIERAAEVFGVGTATVKRWLSLYRKTGGVAPLPVGGVRFMWCGPAEAPGLKNLVAKTPDATVIELADAYNAEHETKVSRSAMGRALLRFGLTLKKKASVRRRR